MKKLMLAILVAACTVPAFAGEIHRSTKAINDFKRTHPCPATGVASTKSCKGYVIDHVKPLACGGADAPSNMQWQTIAEGKAKDKWERKGCQTK